MPARDLQECRRVCSARNYGGFVIAGSTCYFRDASPEELLRIAVHKRNVCLHVRSHHSTWEALHNVDVEPRDWQTLFPTRGGGEDLAAWRSLRTAALEGTSTKPASRVSVLALLRRLRLDPCRAIDYRELAATLGKLFSSTDSLSTELAKQRNALESLLRAADAPQGIAEACAAVGEILAKIGDLQLEIVSWKEKAQRSLLGEALPYRCLKGMGAGLPTLSFSALASFLERALAYENALAQRILIVDALTQCMPEAPSDHEEAMCDLDVAALEASEDGALALSLLGLGSERRARLAALTALRDHRRGDSNGAVDPIPGLRCLLWGLERGKLAGQETADVDLARLARELDERLAAATTGVGGYASTQLRGLPFLASEPFSLRDRLGTGSFIVCEVPQGSLCRALARERTDVDEGGVHGLLVEWQGCIGWAIARDGLSPSLCRDFPVAEHLRQIEEPLVAERRSVYALSSW
eukprot:CAMPEP_0170620360 /NCGR_PEP_ID=MMETSP0224-20130122/28016_1 /TAXON_ID=285029 /ORGANISM="Togula jolla, Strain CCCM 725" /LENGTH=468 /DNA_ID=CAMNT_0010946527 /DNA_START=66 /DNA_END=1469 /DNA_ORIENTATION=-